jgi:dTDP-4-dehydrorhamnose reductase
MRVLLIGATGFLGSTILHKVPGQKNITIIGTSGHSSDGLLLLDLKKYEQVVTIVQESNPDCVINCAAMTDVAECERNPQLARSINSLGPKYLADVCSTKSIRLIHVSTDAVFDGRSGGYREHSKPSPTNVYSRTKLDGEELIKSVFDNYIIVRTNFYGLNPRGSNLMNWILQKLLRNEMVIGIDDIKFNPLWVKDLAGIILALTSHSYTGILNCTGNEVFTKYQFVKKVAYHLGYLNAKIKKGLADEVFSDVKRPHNTYLDNTKLRNLLNVNIHTLREVLSGSEFDEYRSEEIRKV